MEACMLNPSLGGKFYILAGIWLLRCWGRCLKVTFQTRAAKIFPWSWWGAEKSVVHEDTGARSSISAIENFLFYSHSKLMTDLVQIAPFLAGGLLCTRLPIANGYLFGNKYIECLTLLKESGWGLINWPVFCLLLCWLYPK